MSSQPVPSSGELRVKVTRDLYPSASDHSFIGDALAKMLVDLRSETTPDITTDELYAIPVWNSQTPLYAIAVGDSQTPLSATLGITPRAINFTAVTRKAPNARVEEETLHDLTVRFSPEGPRRPVSLSAHNMVGSSPAGSVLMPVYDEETRQPKSATTLNKLLRAIGQMTGNPAISEPDHSPEGATTWKKTQNLTKELAGSALAGLHTTTFLASELDSQLPPGINYAYFSERGARLELEERFLKGVRESKISLTSLATVKLAGASFVEQFRYRYTVGSNETPIAKFDLISANASTWELMGLIDDQPPDPCMMANGALELLEERF